MAEQGRVNRQWRLKSRPTGTLGAANFEWREEPVPALTDGQILVRNVYLSLDPTNRIWMSDMDQYMPPVDLNAPMRGAVCGTVLKSNHPNYAADAVVSGLGSWADYQIGTPETMNPMGELGSIATVDAFSTFAIVGPTSTYTSSSPDSSDTYASQWPFGDKAGDRSSNGVANTSCG